MISFPKDNRIAVIGMGVVGKAVADAIDANSEKVRGRSGGKLPLPVLRLDKGAAEKDYRKATSFFVCVPTPSRLERTDMTEINDVFRKIPAGSFVVVRSTVDPHSAVEIENGRPDLKVIFMPEFLSEDTASSDVVTTNPFVVGLKPSNFVNFDVSAIIEWLRQIFCPSGISKTYLMDTREACTVKHAINAFMLYKNVFFNELFDMANSGGMDPRAIITAVAADCRIGDVHTNPVHKGGRGAGGKCLPKDFRNFHGAFKKFTGKTSLLFSMVENMNLERLQRSGKDIHGIYGIN